MSTVKLKDLEKGDIIKSYAIFSDEKWHRVFDVGPGKNSSYVYLALEGFKGTQFYANEEVEKQ